MAGMPGAGPCRNSMRNQSQPHHAWSLPTPAFWQKFTFPVLWKENADHLPHRHPQHGSPVLTEGAAQGRRGDGGANCAPLVCTASLDLGIDWGDIDLVVANGRAKGSSRLLATQSARVGGPPPKQIGSTTPEPCGSGAGQRFEFLEANRCKQAVDEGQRDGEAFRPGT